MKFFALAVVAFLTFFQSSQADQVVLPLDCPSIPSNPDPAVRDKVYRITKSRNVTPKVLLSTFEVSKRPGIPTAQRLKRFAAFQTAWVESHVNNLNCGDQDSIGVFQQRPSQGWGTHEQIMHVDYSTNKYLDQAIVNDRNHPEYTAGQLAQSVQRSEFPGRYDQAKGKAEEIIKHARQSVGN
ncbi:hypothetical protein FRC08_018395 [Ceratobasidium sp. 394]|nr:hypothetical protein FRC08_018395 [Ceratobasidium sp. 394]